MCRRWARTSMKSRPIEPNRTRDGQLACAFGEPWVGPHFLCQAAVEAITGQPARLADHSHLMPKLLTAGSQIGPETADVAPQSTNGGQSMLF